MVRQASRPNSIAHLCYNRGVQTRPPRNTGTPGHLAELTRENAQLRAVLADVVAELTQVRTQLAQTQAQLAALELERHDLHQEVVDLKCSRLRRADRPPTRLCPPNRVVVPVVIRAVDGRAQRASTRRNPSPPATLARTVAHRLAEPVRRASA
jgi:hypothetical protein